MYSMWTFKRDLSICLHSGLMDTLRLFIYKTGTKWALKRMKRQLGRTVIVKIIEHTFCYIALDVFNEKLVLKKNIAYIRGQQL